MRLSDLRDLRVKSVDGKSLGRVHEVHSDNGKVTALICGAGSFLERLTSKSEGRRIPWESVRSLNRKEVVVTVDPPKRAKAPGASRNRRGTRRPSGRQSKR